MKTEKISVSYMKRIGLKNYSSAEIRVSRDVSLEPGESAKEARMKLFNDAKKFVDSEARKILDSEE